jgi:hypothetical protein
MIDIMRLAPDQLEKYIHLQSIVDRQAADAARVRALRAYYSGEHPVMLTDRQAGVSRATGGRGELHLCA